MSSEPGVGEQRSGLPPFVEIEKAVQTRLISPQSGDPYNLVNTYFDEKYGIKEWSQQATQEAERLLSIMKNRMREQIDPNFDTDHGNLGSIAMNLPYFYPLNLTVLAWLVYGEVGQSSSLEPEQRQEAGERLLKKVAEYDPHRVHEEKNAELIRGRLMPKLDKTPIAKPSAWYTRLNPFRKK